MRFAVPSVCLSGHTAVVMRLMAYCPKAAGERQIHD